MSTVRQIKKSLDLKGRSKTFQGTDLKTLQDHDVSLSKSLDNTGFAAAWVSCQTTQQVITHLNREEPEGQKSSHKEFHTAVVKALRSDPELLAEASGIAHVVQLRLQSKEQPAYPTDWRFCQLPLICGTDCTVNWLRELDGTRFGVPDQWCVLR